MLTRTVNPEGFLKVFYGGVLIGAKADATYTKGFAGIEARGEGVEYGFNFEAS
jgi:hypothetical protein